MYNGSALLANCFCGHCVTFPYPRIPEPDDGPADALFPAQRSVASGGYKRIRISNAKNRTNSIIDRRSIKGVLEAFLETP